MSINLETSGIIVGATVAAVVAIVGGIRWLVGPRLRETITATIKSNIPEVSRISDLTTAIDKLTEALGNQSRDTERLSDTIERLDGKIQRMSEEMSDLAQRTATLEGSIPSLQITAERVAEVVNSAGQAARAAWTAAEQAVSLVSTAKK